MPHTLCLLALLAADLDANRLARIDGVVNSAIKDGKTPGAVVLIVRKDKVAFRKAYGSRALKPAKEEMKPDTVFDLASLTKPIATATSVMLLIERGKLKLSDTAATHLPDFGKNGKDKITIEHLLLHTAGLIADNALADYKQGRKKAIENINGLKLRFSPRERFVYSDVGFIVLGEIVEKLSGQSLDEFARKNIFEPMAMKETAFKLTKALAARAAPTEKVGGDWLQGTVHDPRARLMGGVAGHAGLFSTADDLAQYARMILNTGALDGKRILAPATVRLMTTPRRIPGGRRALGWDARTGFSANRGEFFGGFGHTGFTGTSIWIDPPSETAVIVLCNRVHPGGKGNVTRLRGQIATLAAAAITKPPFPAGRSESREERTVLTGIDVLKRDNYKLLKDRKVGLVTNHTGIDDAGTSTIDLLHKAKDVKLVALFSPEHGIRGTEDSAIADGKDTKTGLPIYSLYGKTRRPTVDQLKGIDTLVYDIQDIGCRFYTYMTTLGYILETAAKHKLHVVVLDRPNPIGGLAVEGPIRDKGRESFVAYHEIPVRHGMTLGELAGLFNKERKINADLHVVKCEGWRRGDLFDRTGLTWVNPSPNMRSLTAALFYPGVGLLETTNVSVGRGTDRPFEVLGAPWIDGRKLAAALNAAALPGVRFVATRFTPAASVHAKKLCGGVQLYITDRARFAALPVGITLACTLKKLHPDDWQTKRYDVLLVNKKVHAAVEKGETAEVVLKMWRGEMKKFLALRSKYLLYKE